MTPTQQVIHNMRYERVRQDTLPLKWSGLCPDCEVLFDRRLACPYCGGKEPVNLDNVLGRKAAA